MKAKNLLRPSMWVYAAQRLCTWYPIRRPLSALVAATKPSHRVTSLEEGNRLAVQLRKDGVALLPSFVDMETVERIRRHLQGALLRERFPPHRGEFTIDDVPKNVHVAEYSIDRVLSCPDVMRIANSPGLLDAAALYLGCKPTISNLSIWWSIPADGTAQEAEYYHRDVDDWRFVKLFVYLNDVDKDGGPHCFVRGSHRSQRFLRIRRIQDKEVATTFPAEDLLQIGGRTGDAFLEDTFGLHKGQPPIARARLLLQVEYSISPIAVYNYTPALIGTYAQALDQYVNRLYVS